MLATTFIDRRSSPSESGLATGDLVLRICGSPRDGQMVRVKSAKCTIGSGPRCTLRLRARGVSPLHCLIVRSPMAAVVRSWAADTRLNHQSFADAALSPGDRLGVGPIELEVVSIGVEPTTAERPVEEDRRQPDELAADLHQREVSLSTQAEHLNAQQADLETQRQAFDQQQQQWQAQQTDLDTQRQAFDQQRQQWQAQQTDLEMQRQALDQERQQWQAQQTDLEMQRQALDRERQQWQAQQADLETQRQAFDQQRQQWQAQQADLETQRQAFDQQQEQVARGLMELESQKNDLAGERRQWEAERAESLRMTEQPPAPSAPVAEVEQSPEPPLPEPQFQAPPEGAPVDLADVLRRVGANVELEEEAPTPSRPAARSERPAGGTRPSPAAASVSAKPEDEEESVEDYMGRLMQRIRSDGGASGPTSYTPPAPQPGRTGRSTSAAAAEVESKQPPQQPAADERPPVSIAPRTVAPEKRIDLSALRELANLSAQSAISRYSRKIIINSMYGKLMVAGVALLAGIALFWMWKELGATPMTYYAALAALLVAIYWGMEYALLSGRLTISKSGHIDIDWNASPHRDRAAPPAETDAAEEAPAEGVSPLVDDGPEPPAAAPGQ